MQLCPPRDCQVPGASSNSSQQELQADDWLVVEVSSQWPLKTVRTVVLRCIILTTCIELHGQCVCCQYSWNAAPPVYWAAQSWQFPLTVDSWLAQTRSDGWRQLLAQYSAVLFSALDCGAEYVDKPSRQIKTVLCWRKVSCWIELFFFFLFKYCTLKIKRNPKNFLGTNIDFFGLSFRTLTVLSLGGRHSDWAHLAVAESE